MIPYFLLLLIPMLLNLFGNKYRLTLNRRVLIETQSACISSFMILFLCLLAFRGTQCGIDTKQYLRLYLRYSSLSFQEIFINYDHELGFKLLNKIVGLTLGHYQYVLVITAGMCVIPLWYFYKRESEDQLLTIVLFLTVAPFVMYFSGIRQAIAMSLGIPAWYAARSRKPIRFSLIILLAMQFHTSAFVLVALYFLHTARITTKWLWFVVPCIIAVFVFRNTIFGLLITLLWKDYQNTPETGATTVLLLLILFGVYAYLIPDEHKLDRDTIGLRNILLLTIVIQIFAMLHPLSMRMNYYYLIFIPVLIPKLANRSKKRFAQVAKLSKMVLIVYFAYYFISLIIKDDDPLSIYPYIPFWVNDLI